MKTRIVNWKTYRVGTIVLLLISLFYQCRVDNCEYIERDCETCRDSFEKNPNSGLCERTKSEMAVLNGNLVTISKGDENNSYSSGGANLYATVDTLMPLSTQASGNNTYDKNGTIVPVVANIRGIWTNGSTGKTRLNEVGVWGGVGNNQWAGFSTCIESNTTKTVCIGVGADNMFRLKVNGRLIVNFINSNTFNFAYWHVFEYTLPAGKNIIEMEGLNTGSLAAFGAEIYDASLADIQTWTSPTDIDNHLIFSTKNQVGKTFQTGTVNGYSCPLGYAIDFCSGDTIPICTLIEREKPVDCPKLILK
ncbi:MAG: hypothetical protein H6607_01080 [Flavobacteriales bacterium]|nr:hypothetical protein [Flavobacteriales bacterium]